MSEKVTQVKKKSHKNFKKVTQVKMTHIKDTQEPHIKDTQVMLYRIV